MTSCPVSNNFIARIGNLFGSLVTERKTVVAERLQDSGAADLVYMSSLKRQEPPLLFHYKKG